MTVKEALFRINNSVEKYDSVKEALFRINSSVEEALYKPLMRGLQHNKHTGQKDEYQADYMVRKIYLASPL